VNYGDVIFFAAHRAKRAAYEHVMDTDHMYVLHWLPDKNRWEPITWAAWTAFRGMFEPFVAIKGILGGIHYFVVCVLDEDATVNIIPHKYLIQPNGQIGPDNFNGWTKEEREDYSRLMVAREEKPGDAERLDEIRNKAGNAFYPPKESLYALANALPNPPIPGNPATLFLDAVAAGTTRMELESKPN
jgi:hypothetical protein